MMKKRISLIFFLLVLAASCLAGCASNKKNINNTEKVRGLLVQTPYIIHALGEIRGEDGEMYNYTNSREAMENMLAHGDRMGEVDFLMGLDGELVCAHSWKDFYFGNIQNVDTLSSEAVRSAKVEKQFTPLTLTDIADYMRKNKDLYIITDTKDMNLPVLRVIADECPDLMDRFIVQIYYPYEYEPAKKLGFNSIILTLYQMCEDENDNIVNLDEVVPFVNSHELVGLTYPASWDNEEIFASVINGIDVPRFVHTVNGKEDKDACFARGDTAVYTDNVEN